MVIFWNHYFNKVGFPWDFSKSYFAVPSFWTAAVENGIIPHWIPFQSMGYPFFLNTQSGFFYPFLWVFPLTKIPFTIEAAVIFQVLHIFAGSVGMFFFLRSLFSNPKYAFLGALAFQFFGAFFSNSEHADIVRGFSILPWFFFVCLLDWKDPKLTTKLFFIPPIVYVLATGGYPGIFISSILMLSVFSMLQAVHLIKSGFERIRTLKLLGLYYLMILLGIGITFVYLGPIVFYGDHLTRFDLEERTVQHLVLAVEHFPGFFMSNTLISGEISMTSSFITIPILIFATFISKEILKKYWIFAVLGIIAMLISFGPSSPVWAITEIAPILELSRFTVSDYRAFFSIPIIILGIATFKHLIESNVSSKFLAVRTLVVIGWFFVGIYLIHSSVEVAVWASQESLYTQVVLGSVFIALSLGLVFFVSRIRSRIYVNSRNTYLILIISSVIIVSNGFFVISDMSVMWSAQPANERYIKHNLPLIQDDKTVSHFIFKDFPSERPKREVTPQIQNFAWKGYLYGTYMMQDHGNTILDARSIIETNETYWQYMSKEWTPIILQNYNLTNNQIPIELFSDKTTQMNHIEQTSYRINSIKYDVSLDNAALLIENEIYFPGWTADLTFSDRTEQLKAIEINDVFRAWNLPQGDYEMMAKFQFPDFTIYKTITLVMIAIWLALFLIFMFSQRKKITLEP